MAELRLNDIGTWIEIDVGVDAASSTALYITYTKPSGTTGYWDAVVRPTGRVGYRTVGGIIDETGVWKVMAIAEFGSFTWTGKETTFTVEPVIIEHVDIP